MKPKILITGATSRTGLPLIRLFEENEIPVRAMIHTASKRDLLERPGVEVVVADFRNPVSLDCALEGMEQAYLVAPPTRDQVELQYEFIDSAQWSGLKRIVKLSALGTDPKSPVELLRWHAAVEEAIRRTDLDWTFLHPHLYQEDLLPRPWEVLAKGRILSPLGKTKIGTVAVDDIAAVAFKVLTERGHAGRTYTVTGPEAVAFEQIAQTLSEVVSRPVRYEEVPFDSARDRMVEDGFPDWMAENLVAMMKTWVKGGTAVISTDVKKVTGHRPLSIREFLTRHQGLFASKEAKHE